MTHHVDAVPPEDEFEVQAETAEEAAAEAAASPTSPHPPAGLSEDEQAAWWMKNVYCGDQMRQLTFRAFVAAAVIGALMAVSNLYVGLKSGWGLGVTITAAVIAYAMFKSLETILPVDAEESALDAGELHDPEFCQRGGLRFVGRIGFGHPGALPLHGPADGVLADDGVAGMRGHAGLLHGDPAETAIDQHRQAGVSHGHRDGRNTATASTRPEPRPCSRPRPCIYCGLVGGVVKFWQEGLRSVLMFFWVRHQWGWCKGLAHLTPPDTLQMLPGKDAHHWLKRYALGFEPSTLFIAAGAIMGIRVGVSMLVGAVVFFGVLGPLMDQLGFFDYESPSAAFRRSAAGRFGRPWR